MSSYGKVVMHIGSAFVVGCLVWLPRNVIYIYTHGRSAYTYSVNSRIIGSVPFSPLKRNSRLQVSYSSWSNVVLACTQPSQKPMPGDVATTSDEHILVAVVIRGWPGPKKSRF